MRRFPLRTLLLMTLALVAFVRLYYVTHTRERPPAPEARAVDVTPVRTQDCRTLDRVLQDVVRAPEDVATLGRARLQLDACPTLPDRACELGAALDARSPIERGATPVRELLAVLCQRCPAGDDPCAGLVGRTLATLTEGTRVDIARLRWNLEHAGLGTPRACAEVVRVLLAPAALAPERLAPERGELLAALLPACLRAGQVPAPVLHAAVVQGEVPALAGLVQEPPAGEGTVLRPDRTLGAPGGDKAFDGQASTGVELAVNEQEPRWRKDGALRAVFEPPVRQLTALRVRARGPGTLRAAIRVEGTLGLGDPDAKTRFVLPVACRFRGTGEWESCALPVSLLSVEALSAFPDTGKVMLNEVEARGTR